MLNIWKLVFIASIYGSIVGCIIILTKNVLKNKINSKWGYIIWFILIIKLLVPYGPQSSITFFRSSNIDLYSVNKVYTNYTDKSYKNYENNDLKDINNKNDTDIINSSSIINDFLDKYGSFINIFIPNIWALGFINISLLFIGSHFIFRYKLNKNHIKGEYEIRQLIEECKRKMSVKCEIRLYVNKFINTPSIVGVFKPIILIPSSMKGLDKKALEYIILHELAHLKRKDILVNYILILIQAIHWFNPLVWYFFKRMREDMELATDEKVLYILEEKEHRDYGKAILTVLEKLKGSQFTPGLIGIIDDKKGVEKRIKNIKGIKLMKKNKIIFTVVGIGCMGVLSVLLLTSESYSPNKSLSHIERSYFEVVNKDINGEPISSDEINAVLGNMKYEIIPGVVALSEEDNGDIDSSSSYNTQVYEFKKDSNRLEVQYLDEGNKKPYKNIDGLTLNSSGEINIVTYYSKLSDMKLNIGIFPGNFKQQESIFKLYNESKKVDNIYNVYFTLGKLIDKDKLNSSQIEKIARENKLSVTIKDLGEDPNLQVYSAEDNGITISMINDKKKDECKQIVIENSKIDSMNLCYYKEEKNIQIWFNGNNLKEHENTFVKVKNIVESI